jgi:hypothetical protein
MRDECVLGTIYPAQQGNNNTTQHRIYEENSINRRLVLITTATGRHRYSVIKQTTIYRSYRRNNLNHTETTGHTEIQAFQVSFRNQSHLTILTFIFLGCMQMSLVHFPNVFQ